MEKTLLKRVFVYKKNGKDIKLTDPDPSMTADQVLSFYSGTYPEMTTASVTGPEFKADTLEYTIKSVVGTKG